MIVVVSAAYILTLLFFLFIYVALVEVSNTIELVSYCFLIMAFLLMTAVTVTNFHSKKKVSSLSYAEMVTTAIDNYFKKINMIYNK
jgi:hypothetical protein